MPLQHQREQRDGGDVEDDAHEQRSNEQSGGIGSAPAQSGVEGSDGGDIKKAAPESAAA